MASFFENDGSDVNMEGPREGGDGEERIAAAASNAPPIARNESPSEDAIKPKYY